MRYRTATIEDLDRLLKLYQAVARTEGGIARLEHEITPRLHQQFFGKEPGGRVDHCGRKSRMMKMNSSPRFTRINRASRFLITS